MDISLAQKAINLALLGDWGVAVTANLELLKINNNDIDALNRLARAYAETGKLDLAKNTSLKALKIDPVNSIALKCLEKWKMVKGSLNKDTTGHSEPLVHENFISHENFIEESGKTKLVTLLHPGDNNVLVNCDSGDEVKLDTHPHSISVTTLSGKYIGKLPDDIAARLRNLIKGGNKYQAIVKSIKSKDVTLFIKETEKGPKITNETSFPTEKIDYVSFTPPELIHKDETLLDGDGNTTEE